jgi:hypothetical protein|nr:MAG TPA: hypothetical protein [Caudoviricetes sp.]
MKKSTFNRLLSIFLMVMAVIFGVNGQVVMAEAVLPDGGTTEGGHAAEAGGATAAEEAGNGGAARQDDGIATEGKGREHFNENGTEFYENDINDKITKIRPMATPVDQISRYATTKSASSFVVEYWSIGTRPIKTTVKETTVESTGTSMVLKVEDPEMFTLDDTIRVVGVKAITNYKNQAYADLTDEPTPDLELCVCGKDNEGYPIVYAVNGKLVNKQPIGIPALQKGQKLIRMAKSCGELDVQTGRFNNLPASEIQYCQNFMIQIEESTFNKIAAKRVDWDFSDIEEDSIYDMRLAMEGTYLFGDMGCIKHTTKNNSAQWFTKGIWWMAGKDIEVGHVATADDMKKGYNKNERVITDLELVDISKDLFVGTGIGNKRKVIIAGSGFVSAFSKIDSDKFRLKDTVEVWDLKFKSWETDFGEVLMIHSELFDLFDMSDCGFAIDPEFLVKRVHLSWTRNVLDLKKAGIRNTDAVVIQEVACLYLKYPKAHARMRLAAVSAAEGTSDTGENKDTNV